jgi:hypothetical protein
MPRFPILIALRSEILSANSPAECKKQLALFKSELGAEQFAVVDATAEGFTFYAEQNVISALSVKKRWKKAEIIELYNSRRRKGQLEYMGVSLGNRSVARVVQELAALARAEP